MVKGLFSLLFYCESGINQYAVEKTLTDVFGVSLLLLELGCLSTHCTAIPFKNTYLCFYEKITSA